MLIYSTPVAIILHELLKYQKINFNVKNRITRLIELYYTHIKYIFKKEGIYILFREY